MIKTSLLIFAALLTASVFAQQSVSLDTLTTSFSYKGHNVFVKNSFASDLGFTVKKVILNGKPIEAKTEQSAFEINLKEYGFQEGEEINIELVHDSLRKPEFLGTAIKE